MIRAVIDTNILIRAVIKPGGSVGPIITRLRAGDYVLIYSHSLLDELAETLVLPRIRQRYRLDPADIETFLLYIAGRGEVVIPDRRVSVCRDTDDNMVLEAALAGRADYIVTGDEDLLVIGTYEGIEIVPAHVFLERLDCQRG